MGFFDKIMDDVLGDPFGSYHAEAEAKGAAAQQAQLAEQGISEQRLRFEEAKKLLTPYREAGIPALGGFAPYQQAGQQAVGGLGQMAQAGAPALEAQQVLAGLRGPEAQRAAIQQIEQSPEMQAMVQQGENAMLQNASATGGLRGGNIQAALAQFRPQVLSQLINQRYGQLGGLAGVGGNVGQFLSSQGQAATGNLASLGQAAAAGQASQGLQTGANIANLLGNKGSALAAGAGAAGSGAFGAMSGLTGLASAGAKLFGAF